MKNFVRLAALAAATTAVATPAFAQAVPSSNGPAQARATIVKPLTLSRVSHLDFGSIVVWGDGTVTMDQAGALTCTAATLVCAASGTPAEFTVTGTNNRVVQINSSNSTITNNIDTLNFTVDAPLTVTLASSGVGNAVNFKVGGSIGVFEATSPGLYSGNMTITVQYQ
jgi:spore coat protein U-like protein